MRIQAQLAVFWLLVLGAGLILEGCTDAAAEGPTFEVFLPPPGPRGMMPPPGGRPTRVELYLVNDCSEVSMGDRPVDPIASAQSR